MERIGISILILTKNEERDLPGCLASVAWSDDIHLLDSESGDRTVEIAAAAGARVASRPFDDYSRQRNHALRELPFRHPWLLIVDADERIPAPLAEEIRAAVAAAADDVAGFRIRRRDFLLGRHLKHVQASPWFIRLVRPERVAYTPRIVNEVLEPLAGGRILDLDQPFDHYPFSKGVDHWFAKHHFYSTLEARQLLAERAQGTRYSLRAALFEPDFNRRRVHQKGLYQRLPCRPLLRFLILYLLKRGFLDGRPGYLYARMQSLYERMIVLKYEALALEERDRQRGG